MYDDTSLAKASCSSGRLDETPKTAREFVGKTVKTPDATTELSTPPEKAIRLFLSVGADDADATRPASRTRERKAVISWEPDVDPTGRPLRSIALCLLSNLLCAKNAFDDDATKMHF